MNAVNLIGLGIKRSFRYWQLLGLWYLFYLMSAVVLAILPAIGLLDFSHNTAIRDLADGMDAWMLSDLLLGGLAGSPPGSPAGAPAISPAASISAIGLLVILILLPLLAWLPAVFLTGGTLQTFASAPTPFNFKLFLKDCRAWFGSLILLSLIELAGLVVLIGAAMLLLPFAFSMNSVLGYGLVFLFLLLYFLGLVFFDLTAAALIASERRAVFPAFRAAFQTIVHRPLTIFILFILALGLLLILHIIFRIGIFPVLPFSIWPLVLIAQQAFIALRLWTRLIRWAGGVEAVKSASPIYP